ncbi:hypothetical protein DICSQDRAFT_13360, partial [Dichomitus squalens LYAD-421 SS1]|uniref:uncharacterized protein n=1 Tax=Dichomitus squalens (strain LYAD-421) TaxID=732165 RepID=UPI0004414640
IERAQQRWRSPVYGFFRPDVEVSYKNGQRSHVFRCAAKGCKAEVRRYLDTHDRASSGNLFKHARACWGDEVVDHAIELGDADVVREKVVKAKLESKSITDFFQQKNPDKLKFSHRLLTKAETRCDLRPFTTLKDRGFLMIVKCGHPGFYVPSPTTVSRDVKVVFVATRKRLARMLQSYPGRLSFATDAWTSPNHHSFVAITIHLELRGKPLRMLLDLVELAKSHTGINLAVTF